MIYWVQDLCYLGIDLLNRDTQWPSQPQGHGAVNSVRNPEDSSAHFLLKWVCGGRKTLYAPVIAQFDALTQCEAG